MEKKLNLWIKICFLAYFVVLIAERCISVILTANNGINMFGSNFDKFTYFTVFASMGLFLIFLLLKARNIFKFKEENPDYQNICIASGILLLSGMVHTHYTIPAVQFVAYGILIAGIVLKTIILNKNSDNRKILWLSFAYLICFSMAIPVMYHSEIKTHFVFHLYEIAAMLVLVGLFTFLLVRLFNEEENLFLLVPAIIMAVVDIILIIWRWQEEINFFVLVSMSLAVILFVVGYILSKKQPNEVIEQKPAPAAASAPEKVEQKPEPKEEAKPQNQNPNKGNNNNKGNGKGKKQSGKKSNGKKYSTKGKK